MINLLALIVCFFASVIGAICGIGGGVIIKPVLDSVGILDVTAISFLSGCTVLSMTTYSVLKNRCSGTSHISARNMLPLAIGASIGGVAGRELFSYVKLVSGNNEKVGAVQAFCLLIITFGTLLYTLYKSKIKTYRIDKKSVCFSIGAFLGIISSFLGIGGGPINLVVLFFFFSMPTKIATENSLYIIFFSQGANLISTIISGNVPEFKPEVLILMIVGGIAGGICGRKINEGIDEKIVDMLFIGLMIMIMLINVYNIYKYI